MEVIKRQMATWFVAIVGILAFTSCDEDWWDNWEPNVNLTGRWEIREISGWNCPYRTGDTWTFYSNGNFDGDGYGLQPERGYWRTSGRRSISISMNGYNTDMSVYIRDYDYDYMTLDVTDYTYNTNYTLRLAKRY